MGLFDRAKSMLEDVARPAAPAPVVVAPEWPQWTTLACCGNDGPQKTVGEASYQPALEWAALGRNDRGGNRRGVVAQLVRDPKNRYDADAVQVLVGGHTVGFLPADVARGYHPVLDHLAGHGSPATCRAELTGGWDRCGGDRGHFGIELDCSPAPWEQHHAFLPDDRRLVLSDQIEGIEVEAIFFGRLEFDSVVQLTVHEGRVCAWHNGTALGYVTAKSSAEIAGLLSRVNAAGFPCTASATVIRPSKTQKRDFDVQVGFPSGIWKA